MSRTSRKLVLAVPTGKEAITAEAVLFAGRTIAGRIRAHLAETGNTAEAGQSFVETIACHGETSGFKAGGPLTSVASETARELTRLIRNR
jgi:hypothetical protein